MRIIPSIQLQLGYRCPIIKSCAYMLTTFIILNFFIKYVMILHRYK